MTNRSNENELWMAHLDGELTAAESAALEAKLSPEQRQRLAAERRFEAALGDVLTEGEGCPDLLWKRLTQQIEESAGPKRGGSTAGTRWFFPLTAAAAVLLVALGAWWVQGETMPAAFHMEAANAAELSVEVLPSVGADEKAVQTFLARAGIPVRVQNMEAFNAVSHHPVALLGVGETEVADGPVTELLFTCCGKPTRVILAAADSPAAREMQAAVDQEGSDMLEVRRFDGYVAGLVSKHRTNQVLNSLQGLSWNQAASAV